jgi:hypothetical protein
MQANKRLKQASSLNTEFVFPARWKMGWSHITVGLFLAINAGLFLAFAFLFRDDRYD